MTKGPISAQEPYPRQHVPAGGAEIAYVDTGIGHSVSPAYFAVLTLDRFDVAMSFTAMQDVDADRMIREMMRATKSGGRVGVWLGVAGPNVSRIIAMYV